MILRYGNPPLRRRYTYRPGVYAILPKAGRILVTHQAAPIPEFQLPGGGIDAGEHPIPALHREVAEETGWVVSEPRKLGVYRRFTYMEEYDLWAEKLCHIYVAHPVYAKGPPTEPGHAAIWLDPDDALGLLGSQGDSAMLADYLSRA